MKYSNAPKSNRSWLVFANEDICDHYKSLNEAGFISWKRNDRRYKMREGDIVYIFSSTERKIIYKTEIVCSEKRADSRYWKTTPPNDITWRLKSVQEYNGQALDEPTMKLKGFKGGGSIQTPMCNNPELFEYIENQFDLQN